MEVTIKRDINDAYWDLDLNLPIHPLTGNLTITRGAKAVSKAVRHLVLMSEWDTPFQPEVNCGIRDMLFEQNSAVFISHIQTRIEDAIKAFEPRVKVRDVSISRTGEQTVTITIQYEVVAVDELVTTSIVINRDR